MIRLSEIMNTSFKGDNLIALGQIVTMGFQHVTQSYKDHELSTSEEFRNKVIMVPIISERRVFSVGLSIYVHP